MCYTAANYLRKCNQICSHTPSVLNAGAERRATTSPAAGFDEGRPGVARSAGAGGRLSHTTNMKKLADTEKTRSAMNSLKSSTLWIVSDTTFNLLHCQSSTIFDLS